MDKKKVDPESQILDQIREMARKARELARRSEKLRLRTQELMVATDIIWQKTQENMKSLKKVGSS